MIAVILAGGSGTRFWPLSRNTRPKQLLPLYGDKAMIAHTADRVREASSTILVVTGDSLLEATRAALPDLAADAFLAEPTPRNTAPAVGLAAVVCRARHGDEPVAILPSDHFIRDAAAFRSRLAEASAVADEGWIVTLGIAPTHPETGYGYIRYVRESLIAEHAHPVEAFVEKPDFKTAVGYVTSNRYVWNAGIFVFKPSTMLEEIERQMPDLFEGLREIEQTVDSPDFVDTVARVFPALPRTSIDYGVMEGAKKVAVIPADVGWSDVGHWGSLDAVEAPDDLGNIVRGQTVTVDTSNTVVFNTTNDAVTAVVGLQDFVVVHTDDAVLVMPRDRAQDVRAIVEELKRRGPDFG